MKVFRAPKDYPRWPAVATLIHRSFDYMTPRLGHPARAMEVTPDRLAAAANPDTALLVEDGGDPVACLFTRPSRDFSDALYLGWLAVAQTHRRRGLALALVNTAEDVARSRNLVALTLDTGRELVSLQAMFLSMGFQQLPNEGVIVRFRKPIPDARQILPPNGDLR